MTHTSSIADGGAAALISQAVQPAQEATIRNALENLGIALEATRLAADTANEMPLRAGALHTDGSDILEKWRVTNLLLHEVFDNLYFEGRHTISTLKMALGLD